MDIISQFNTLLKENFEKFLKNYFNTSIFWNKSSCIDNYINFMDEFHFKQALQNLTTNKYPDIHDALLYYSNQNNKKDFENLCNDFIELCPEREETIVSKMNYILNNWHERQIYKSKSYLKCSMESHISHIFADIFTSRPKSYSKKGLRQLLKLRLLKVNNVDIKQKYLDSLKPKENITFTNSKLNRDLNNYKNYDFNRKLNYLNNCFDINFI